MSQKSHFFITGFVILIAVISHYTVAELYKAKKITHLYTNESLPPTYVYNSAVDILIFGDSRASDWNPSYFKSKQNILNMGIAGETTNSMLNRSHKDIIQYAPKYVIICAGINDIIAASLFKSSSQRQAIIDSAVENLTQISTNISVNNIRIIFVLLTPPYAPDPIRKHIWGDNINVDVRYINQKLIKHLQTLKNVNIIDPHSLLFSQGDIENNLYRLDSLHYTPLAYNFLSIIVNESILGDK